MAEKLRLFVGVTELNYSSAFIEETEDEIINNGRMTIEANSNVTISSTIDFKKVDGSTLVFSAVVEDINQVTVWESALFTNGYELQNIPIEQVYTGVTPEFIVQDIIDNSTVSLTFASSEVSGFTITEYVANGYAIDVIKDMMDLLRWPLRITRDDEVYFEPEGSVNNGAVLTNAVNIDITSWIEDKRDLINRVKVRCANITRLTSEPKTGTATEFLLTEKPVGTVKATVSGSEIIQTSPTEPYRVEPDNKKVIFDVAQTDPTLEYSFSMPVVVDDQDDLSIATHKLRFKKIDAPWIDNFPDARKYAREVLDIKKNPKVTIKGSIPGMNFDYSVNELVTISDPIRNKPAIQVIIRKIKWIANNNTTLFEFGRRLTILYDWQREVQDRIKKLERRVTSEQDVAFSRTLRNGMKVTVSISQGWNFNSPVDSFILGHQTLSRLRPNLNFEADCSDNDNNGIWTGTGIDGSQYTTSGWRLSAGIFNGSDRIITVADHSDLDLSGDFAIMIPIKLSSLPGAETYILNKWDGTDGYALRITASNTVELIYSNSGSDSTIATTTALTAGTYMHLSFVKSGTDLSVHINGSPTPDNTATGDASAGTNNNDLEIGRYGANYLTGDVDEIRFYDAAKTTNEITDVYNKIQINQDMKLYLSMDNPRLGDRSTAKSPVV